MDAVTLREFFNLHKDSAGTAFFDPAIKATKVNKGDRLDGVVKIDRPLVTFEENGWLLTSSDKRELLTHREFSRRIKELELIKREDLLSQNAICFNKCSRIVRIEKGEQMLQPRITGSSYYGINVGAPVAGYNVYPFETAEPVYHSELDFFANMNMGVIFNAFQQSFYRSNNVSENDLVDYVPICTSTRFTNGRGATTFGAGFSIVRNQSIGELSVQRNTSFDQQHRIIKRDKVLTL